MHCPWLYLFIVMQVSCKAMFRTEGIANQGCWNCSSDLQRLGYSGAGTGVVRAQADVYRGTLQALPEGQ